MFKKLLLIMVLLSVAAQVNAQATVALPALTGAYTVARTMYQFETDRAETFTAEEDDQRAVVVSIFYPAAGEGEIAPYIDPVLAGETLLGMPVDVFEGVQGQVFRESPAAEGQFPVILFSPGMGTVPLFYTGMLSELASHGYVVVALWHPYSTEVVPQHEQGMIYAVEEGFVLPNPETYRENAARVGEAWVGDVITVLDELEQMQADDNLFGDKLNLDQIGLVGHSFGGAVALEAAAQDTRIDAVINMDGVPFGTSADEGISQPTLFMGAEPFVYTEALRDRGITEEAFNERMALAEVPRRLIFETAEAGYWLVYQDALHNNYTTDFNLIAPLDEAFFAPMIGTVGGERLVEVINTYALAFFEQHLRGAGSDLLSGASLDYPEASLEVAG